MHVVDRDGVESRIDARAVIDASGTWTQPNPAGADGYPALGERAAAAAGVLTYLPPTPAQAAGLAGRHVVVVGSGHSAMTAVIELADGGPDAAGHPGDLGAAAGAVGDAFGGGAADELPQRGALGQRARQAVEDGLVRAGDRLPDRGGRADATPAWCWSPRTAGGWRRPTGWWC